jgi:hypothetical protein
MKSTLSFRMSELHNEGHNLRTIYVPYVDTSKSKDNIYYVNHTKEEAYEFLFADAVKEYNEKQKRKDRRIEDYLKKILEAEEKQKKLIEQKRAEGCSCKELAKFKKAKQSSYELIVSLGNMKQNPEFCPDGERADDIVAILNEYIYNFQDRNTNAYLYLSTIHLDEQGVIHAHMDVIFYSDSYKSGMSRRVSLNRALEDMGFKSDKEKDGDGKFNLAVTKWQNREREELKEIAKKYDIEIVNGNQSRQHLNRERYIIEQKKEELKKKEKSIDNCVSQIDDFIKNDNKGTAFYYSVELSKREKELEKLKKNFDDVMKDYRRIKEKEEVQEV